MFDHYTRQELAFRANCTIETLNHLAKVGPGFDIIEIKRGDKMRGYVIRKDQFFAWVRAVRKDEILLAEVKRRAPAFNFISISLDQKKWASDRAEIQRVQKVHERRPYGQGIKANECK